jgi:hypothetical protein
MQVIVILALLASVCHARLWETYAECVNRYGKEKSATKESNIFEKNGIEIIAGFELTKCVAIAFRSLNGQAFTDQEIQKLLDANGGGSKWNVEKPREGFNSWKTQDEKSLAYYNTKEKKLFFLSNAWITNKQQIEKDARDKALDRF